MRVVTIAVVVALACVLGAVHGAASATPGVKVNADVSWPQSFATLPSMSREALAEHDGSDPDRPIYMAIKGFVFDVSSGRRFYSKKGAYNALVGKDCSQAVARMSLDDAHVNDDISSLSQEYLRSLEQVFQSTYMAKYPVVAQVEGSPFRQLAAERGGHGSNSDDL